MSDETIQPALTAEQWEEHRHAGVMLDGGRLDVSAPEVGWGLMELHADSYHKLEPQDRHALAALALYGQPFGFTHREAMDMAWLAQHAMTWFNLGPVEWAAAQRVLRAAGKVAALLPPATETER